MDQKLRPDDAQATHRLESVSDGTCFFEVVQPKAGDRFAMRKFESKAEPLRLDFYRYQLDPASYFMRGVPLLQVIEDKSFEFTRLEINKGPFGEEWALDFRFQIQDIAFRTGTLTFLAQQGFQLKSIASRPAAPYTAQLMTVDFQYRASTDGKPILDHVAFDDVNIHQVLTYKEMKSGGAVAVDRFNPKYFGLTDPREVKTGLNDPRPILYFAGSSGFLLLGMLARKKQRRCPA